VLGLDKKPPRNLENSKIQYETDDSLLKKVKEESVENW
jgi:hypothetical protein